MPRPTKKSRKQKKSAAQRQRPESRQSLKLTGWQKDMVVHVFLLALVIAFFWPILMKQAFFWEDFPEHYYPFRSFPAVELSEGRFPFWCSYIFGGIPFFAMIDTAVLYPFNLIYVLFVDHGVLNFFITELHTIGHVLLMGIGMYYLCRSLGVGRLGASGGAVTFMLTGVVVHHLFHVVILNPMAWIPPVFMLFIRAMDRICFRTAVAAGGILGILISAGHPQVFVYVAYAMGLYTLTGLIDQIRSSGVNRNTFLVAGVSATTMAVGMGLAAVVLLPMSELIGFSLRPNVSYEVATSYSLHIQQLITFLMPDFYGRSDQTIWNYWGPGVREYGHFWETYVYVGVLPLLLAGVTLVMKRERIPWYFGVLAGLSLLLSLGGSTPVYRIVYEMIPGIDKFRAPARFGILFAFAIAVLVGYAIDTLMTANRRTDIQRQLRRYLTGVCGVVIVGVFVAALAGDFLKDWLATGPDLRQKAEEAIQLHSGRFVFYLLASIGILVGFRLKTPWNTSMAAAAVGIIALDLFSAGYAFNLGKKGIEEFYPNSSLVQFLQDRQKEEWGRAALRSGSRLLMRRNAGMLSHIYTLEGYASPLRLDRTLPPILDSRAHDLMNVRYRITIDEQSGATALEDNPTALPRAFIVRNYVVAPNMEAVTAAMTDASFDYRTTVTLDKVPTPDIPADTSVVTDVSTITHFESNRLVIAATMTRPGLLVLSEVYYPAWKAYVDGQPVPVYLADGALRAVALTTGSHQVEFRYESSYFLAGGILSSLTLLVIVFTGIFTWKRRRR